MIAFGLEILLSITLLFPSSSLEKCMFVTINDNPPGQSCFFDTNLFPTGEATAGFLVFGGGTCGLNYHMKGLTIGNWHHLMFTGDQCNVANCAMGVLSENLGYICLKQSNVPTCSSSKGNSPAVNYCVQCNLGCATCDGLNDG